MGEQAVRRNGVAALAAAPPVPVLLLVVALAAVGPWLGGYWQGSFIVAGIWAMVAIGLSLLAGYAGQISLGHAAFYGIGAYACGILTGRYGLSPWLGLLAAALITAALAYPIGAILLQLRGHYLAIGTLGFGIIANIAMLELVPLTGGPSGFSGIPRPDLFGLPLSGDREFYYLVLALTALVLLLSLNLVGSAVGRTLRALHASEIAAETLGIDTGSYKLRVFTLSALYAGLAGGLFAQYVTFVSPKSFNFLFSVELVVMVALGGMASVWGALLGATLVLFLSQLIRAVLPALLPNAGGEVELVVFGLLLVAIMLGLPRGVVPELARRLRPPGARRSVEEARPAAVEVSGDG